MATACSALRAFTPRDQKAVKAAATTYRSNPELDVEKEITELGVGEALVSVLDEKGSPTVVERAFVCPPRSRIGAISADERAAMIKKSAVYGHYEKEIDRESAFEVLKERAQTAAEAAEKKSLSREQAERPQRARQGQTVAEAFIKSAARAVGSQVGRQIVRGVLGSLLR